ncbi:MAG TPA: hypothetical protein PKD64_03105 [Pirellulaceae bacterium]|nr:hypothetical protein [Pirellulaceae bacterium]HMO91158.1 hypothetical protein [Pirellulaceae bacterium]HMP69072.1 hypothetical protein [Pirellulaceae bacterium]
MSIQSTSRRLIDWFKAIVVSSCLLTSSIFAQDSSLELQLNLHRTQEWLGSGQTADYWREYLWLGELEALSALGLQADVQRLSEIGSLLNTSHPAIDHPIFQSLNQAIQRQVAAIDAGQRGKMVLDEENGFQEITNANLESAKQDLLAELILLRQFISETFWGIDRPKIMRELQLNELIALLESIDFLDEKSQVEGREGLDQRQRKIVLLAPTLRSLKPKYRIATSQHGDFYLQIVEHRLDYFERLCTWAVNSTLSERNFRQNLKGFNENVEKLHDPSNRYAQLKVSQGLGWLYHMGQAPDVISAVRQQYSKPNFRVTVQESLLNEFARRRPVRDVRWIDEVILDNRAQGFAFTNGSIGVDLVPNDYEAHIEINLNGTINSNSKTKKGPITGFSSSFATFSANRPIIANVGGLLYGEADAWADLTTAFLGTDCCLNLVNQIADQEYLKRKDRSEQIASGRARERIFEQFDEETAKELDKGKESIAEAHLAYFKLYRQVSEFRYRMATAGKPLIDAAGNPFKPADVFDYIRLPESRINTNETALFVHSFLEDWNRLGAVNDPPETAIQADLLLQIHESMLSNLASTIVDGKTFKSSEFADIAESFASEVPDNLRMDGDKEFTITFEKSQPVQFVFEDQKIGVIINGANFRKDRNDTGPMFIRANFKLIDVDGKLKLVRDGSLKADFSEPGQRSVEQITVRTVIQDQLDAMAEQEVDENEIELPADLIPRKLLYQIEGFEQKDELDNFRLVVANATDGWLTLGWQYRPQRSAISEPSVKGFLMETPLINVQPADQDQEDDFVQIGADSKE